MLTCAKTRLETDELFILCYRGTAPDTQNPTCERSVFGSEFLQKPTLRQGFGCQWFIWEAISGNTGRGMGGEMGKWGRQ